MQATGKHKGRGGNSIDRLLGLLCAVLLLAFFGGCVDEGPTEAAGHEPGEAVQLASESSESALEKPGEAVEEAAEVVEEAAEPTEATEPASQEAGQE